MPQESGEWRFTYGVEIDAAQVRAAAQAMRVIFAEALRDLDVGKALAGQSGAGGQIGAVRSQLSQIETSTQRSQQRLTAITAQEAHERARIERTNTQITLEEARKQRVQAEQEQQRLTAATKAEIKERQAAQRSAAATAASTRQAATMAPLMGASRMVSGLAYGALGAIGMYGLESTARTLYTAGRTGAQQQRTAETFDYLAKQAGISAEAMTSAINKASRGTITDMNAMALSAQVLAQAFSGSSEDIVGDTATLVQASRRLAQIYVDKEGNAQTTEQVFSRMIGFVREGNKELVDQFGITNQRIADTLGISTDGLAGAAGAADRFRGIIAILGEEMERLGGATETTADRIEAAEVRITNAKDKMRAALSGPTADVAEFGASVIERVSKAYTGEHFVDEAREYIAQLKAEQDEIQYASRGWILLQMEINKTTEEIQHYEQVLSGAADKTEMAAGSIEQMRDVTSELSGEAGLSAAATHALGMRIGFMANQALAAADALAEVVGRVTEMDASFTGTLQRAASGVTGIAGLGESLRMFDQQRLVGQNMAGMLAQGGIPPQLWPMGIGPDTEITDANLPIIMDAVEDLLTKPFDDMVEAERESKRLQDQAAREWESAAEKTQRAWESAAEATVAAFESTLESIPGIFGTSKVSEDDMKMAELGIYEPQADEYLRQLRDEVRNKVDYEGVDIYDAARRGGIDQGLPQEAILALFEKKWENQTLFADKANLDLFNPDAVRREFGQREESKQGRQNILEFFGMDESIMGDLTAEFQAQLAGQQQQFGTMGGDMAKALFGGYQKSIETAQWFTPIVDTVTAQVLESINSQMAEP